LCGLQELADTRNCSRTRFATVAQVENEARVALGLAPETGWRDVGNTQEILDFSEQVHS
jgi:hypothetical protein